MKLLLFILQLFIEDLNVDDLEEVAYLSPNEAQGVRGVRFAIGGALVITTRSGKPELKAKSSLGQVFVMKGLDDVE